MKILTFSASNVYGYMNFEVKFNSDVNFLVGSNGSGKSTIIKLIQALLTPNIKELSAIPFENIKLSYIDRGDVFEISGKKNKVQLSLRHSAINEEINIPIILSEDKYGSIVEIDDKIYDHFERDIINSPIVKRIKSTSIPVFLGLDRKTAFEDNNDFAISRKEYILKRRMFSDRKRTINGSLGDALLSTEILIQDSYRRIREVEERQDMQLRDNILKSSFKFTGFDVDDFQSKDLSWRSKSHILERRDEIIRAIKKIGNANKSLLSEIDAFFDKLTNLFEQLRNQKEEGLTIEWFLNKSQIDRISSLVDVIDEYNIKIHKMYAPINQFLSTVNVFFKDSKKKLEVNTVGQLIISRPDNKKCNIDILSSGERQLLVIIANVMLNRYANASGIIIIDEPEISLHLKWQELFSQTILSVSPNTQFILATHSPDIVGELTDKCKKIGG
ncbi:AAA family ATPase [Serratia fonticola]|uniref:AAA family ATPase n=1 Tax=Serratia fonticola TaxID=47917 RepID=UPI003AAE96A4